MTAQGQELDLLIKEQEGLVTRWQALAGGLGRHALQHRMRRGGSWRPLLPAVYITVTGTPTQEQLDMAAVLYGGRGSVITGPAALRHHGMAAPRSAMIDILIPADRQRRSTSFVATHRTIRMPRRVTGPPPRYYALPARAAADTARWLTDVREVRAVVAGAVQSGRCTVDEVADELREGPAQHSALLRTVLAEVADGALSAPEAELRSLILKAGLPRPMYNPWLYLPDGTFIARPDVWWAEAGVAVEVDSRRWHFSEAGWQRTMDRHDAMGEQAIVVLHFTPQKIRTNPDYVVSQMTNAYKAGKARPRLHIIAVPASGPKGWTPA